jgi:hypothetical protein
MAAGRIVLLALSVGLFAAMWHGDRPAPQAATVTSARLQPIRDTLLATRTEILPSPADLATSPFATLDERWQRALPLGVVPGEYLLAEGTGRSQRVMITFEMLHALGQDPDVRGEPIYPLATDGQTAYLIRITPHADRLRIANRHR